MRVLYVSPYAPSRDGIGTYTMVLSGAVESAGHTIAVAAPSAHSGAPAEVLGAISPRSARTHLHAAVGDFGPDVVHVQFAVPAFGGRTPRLIRWLGEVSRSSVPIVTTMHEATRDIAALRGIGRTLYRRIADLSDHIIVHTQGAAEVLREKVGVPAERVQVIPHFSTDPPAATTTAGELRSKFGLGAGERLLLLFGFIHVDKGLDDLVRAAAALRDHRPAVLTDVKIIVAGVVRRRNGPFRLFELRDVLHLARVRRLAARHGLLERLVFTGFVPDGDIAAWFEAAEAVVLPYKKAEQSGVANLARAYGAPVIATTAGGLAELFSGSPWTVPPASPERLAEVVGEFLASGGVGPAPPSTRTAGVEPGRVSARITPAGEATTRSTRLDDVAAATTAVYRSLAEQNGRRRAHGH